MIPYTPNSSDPAEVFEAITPSDTVSMANRTRGVYVGGGGNIVAISGNNVAVTFSGVLAGTILPIRTLRVNATGTTATGLVALV